MADETITATGIAAHGASRLPSVEVDSFNLELKDEEGFLGDRASKGAFRETLEKWRKPLRKSGEDPFGKELSEDISKKELDAILVGDDTDAWAVVQSAIEDFAQELAHVTRRFLKTKPWDKTERIVVGGGISNSRLGELAIARAEIILKAENFKIEMLPIHRHPDDAGTLSARSILLPPGSSKLTIPSLPSTSGARTSAVALETRRKKAPDLTEACVWKSELWRHADDEPSREEAVKRLVKMLKDLIAKAENEGFKLAPFIGIACPGVIESDGSIAKGAQNLPGNWESCKFNLPATLVEAIPRIGEHDTAIVMHNDGVVQGLSEVPFMQNVKCWGVLTIGTGLGNARFTNRNGKGER